MKQNKFICIDILTCRYLYKKIETTHFGQWNRETVETFFLLKLAWTDKCISYSKLIRAMFPNAKWQAHITDWKSLAYSGIRNKIL